MARKIRELDGLGSELFDQGGDIPTGEEGPTEEVMPEGDVPLDSGLDEGAIDPAMLGDLGGEMPVDGDMQFDPSQPDLSQLSDEDLMAMLDGGGDMGGGMNQVGPQVDMLEGALGDEGTSPDERSMIENDLALAARRRMAGL